MAAELVGCGPSSEAAAVNSEVRARAQRRRAGGKRGGGGDYRVASPGGTGAEKATVSPHGRQVRDLAAEGLDDGREAPVRRLEIGCGAQEVTACRR